jgi:hypothetical protein
MAFCGNCGTKADSNKFCTNCGSPIVINAKSKGSNFGQLLDLIERNDAVLALGGLVNIESGEISVRAPRNANNGEFTHPLTDCDKCNGQKTQGVLYFVNCDSCQRSNENYFWIKSGNGDGIYTVLEIWQGLDEDLSVVGIMAILVPTVEFTQPIVDEAIKNEIQIVDLEHLRAFDDLEVFELTSMNVAGGELYITDTFTGFDSGNSSYTRSIFEETTFDFYAFAEISPADQNANSQGERAAVMKVMVEEFGASSEPSEISVIPRVIIGLDQQWVQANGFGASSPRPDDEGIFWDWFTGNDHSHINPETGTAAWFNAAIANIKYGDEYLDIQLSYLLLGAAHGDQDCLKALLGSKFKSILNDSEKVADLFLIQDQLLIENEIRESGDVKGWLKKL